MMSWLLLILTLAGPASAQVTGRVSIGEAGVNAGQAGAVSPVTAIGAGQLGSLSPAVLGGSLSAAPSAPAPTFAAPAIQAARVAPASVLAAQPLTAAAEFKPADASMPAALAPSAAKTPFVSDVIGEGVAPAAAPLPALEGAARMAADPGNASFEIVFDGGKSKRPFFSLASFGGALRIPAAALTRGGPAERPQRIVEFRGREAVRAPKGRMPAGVMDAFAKALIVIAGAGGLSAYLWSFMHAALPAMTAVQFTASFLPLTLMIPHFGLVAAFWWGRYRYYPKLGRPAQARFRAVASAVAVAYPVLALTGLGLWAASIAGGLPSAFSSVFMPWSAMLTGAPLLSAGPLFAGILAVIGVLALTEVFYHFIWRAPTKKSGGRGGIWGNLGQQILLDRRRA